MEAKEEGDDREQQRHQHSLQRELEDLQRERRYFMQFLRSEGGKDLVSRFKVYFELNFLTLPPPLCSCACVRVRACGCEGRTLTRKGASLGQEWCIVQTLRADEESVFSLFSPELIVLIFSHLDECSLATVSEARSSDPPLFPQSWSCSMKGERKREVS
jgi:hypothetical protein